MDPGERRREAARTAKVGFLLIANVAAVLFLVQALGGEDRGDVAAREATETAPVELAVPGRTQPEGPGADAPRLRVPGSTTARASHLASPASEELVRAAGQDPRLAAELDRLVANAVADARRRSKGKVTASNTVVALHVYDPATRRELVSRLADESLRPASNMKLVTSAAALVLFGSDWHFETRIEAAGPVRDGVLHGDLIVRAGGDPLLDADGDGQVAHFLTPALQRMKSSAGLRRIEGDLVLDEGSYLEPGPGPGWPDASQHWQEHCALAGGFSANAGCLTAVVKPGRVGAGASSALHPLDQGLSRKGSVRTAKARSKLNIAVGATATAATLRGEIPADVEGWVSRFAHPDPVELFGDVFRGALKRQGITLEGKVVRRRGTAAGEHLASLRTPLTAALIPIHRDSNNAAADQLFFALGAAAGGGGTRQGGARAVERALRQLGLSSAGLVQVDGSGLSRDDRVTARQLVRLLAAVDELEPAQRAAFFDSLPVSGKTGSLANRMKEGVARGRVHAKTGWIEGAGALSGIVETESGGRLCFSILVDYPRVAGMNRYCWKPMQDEICAELARWESN